MHQTETDLTEERAGSRAKAADRAADDVLVQRWRSGEEIAFRSVVERYSGPLLAHVLALVHHLQDAEDAVQETFIRAHRSRHQLREPGKLWFWLKQIARNVAMDSIRAARKAGIPTAPEVLRGLGHAYQQAAEGGDEGREGRDDQADISLDAIISAVETLPETYRQTAVYFYLQEWPYQKIADTLGIDPAAARQRISRAGKLLRSALASARTKGVP